MTNDLAQCGIRRYAVQNHRDTPNAAASFFLSITAKKPYTPGSITLNTADILTPINTQDPGRPPETALCNPPGTDSDDLHALLLRLPLFRSLSQEQLDLIARACHLIPIARHEFVFRKGDPANGLYIVASGSVKLSLRAANGQEKIIEFFHEGDTFGEALMFLEMPYASQAQALKESLVIWIKKENIDQALEQIPSFARHLLASVSLRLHTLMQDIETTHLQNAMQRVLRYLLDLPRIGNLVNLPFHKKTIASKLGLTPETLSRLFQQLINKGQIAVKGRHVEFKDEKSLRAQLHEE